MDMEKIKYEYVSQKWRDFPGVWLPIGMVDDAAIEKEIKKQVRNFIDIIAAKVPNPVPRLAAGVGASREFINDQYNGRDAPYFQIWNLLKIIAIDPEKMMNSLDPTFDFRYLLK
jgi:hypothetical protein